MDDFFGGPLKTKDGIKSDKLKANLMFKYLLAVGDLTGTKMNDEKCLGPARVMEILGFIYDSILKYCKLSKKKQTKYLARIEFVLNSSVVRFKFLEKFVGNLTYAAWIAPFGRPFLSVLSGKLTLSKKSGTISVSTSMRNALLIWRLIILKNKGLSFNFILTRLPRAKNE